MPKFSDLKFVRLTEPGQFQIIPRYLFEQIKDFDFDIERLYRTAPLFEASPVTLLYVLVDPTNVIKGVLWADVNIIFDMITINVFSVAKAYQSPPGEALKGAITYLKSQFKNAPKAIIQTVTKRPRAYKRAGWHNSDRIIMEI